LQLDQRSGQPGELHPHASDGGFPFAGL
jgi:hypothetical protein